MKAGVPGASVTVTLPWDDLSKLTDLAEKVGGVTRSSVVRRAIRRLWDEEIGSKEAPASQGRIKVKMPKRDAA